MPSHTLLWFRNDLRIHDHPALVAAAKRGTVTPVYIHAPDEERPWSPGAATRWWLHHSLDSLRQELHGLGLRLIIRHGPSQEALQHLAKETEADAVMWSRRYEPVVIARDRQLKGALKQQGLHAESFNSNLLVEPWEIQTQAGRAKVTPSKTEGSAPGGHPYKVFTPYWRACLAQGINSSVLPVPHISGWHGQNSLKSLDLGELQLLPRIAWDAGFKQAWECGATGAGKALNHFIQHDVESYQVERDRPDHAGTSRLSPALHFGELSPRMIWHRVTESLRKRHGVEGDARAEPYLRQLIWREFAHHLLYHFPETPDAPLKPEFAKFPWRDDQTGLQAWQQGQTGYPIVDAGMRQLWMTGWMHNRVRMIVGSFLVKDLRVAWQAGAEWFWDTLVDADLPNNTLGWQWIAGCGADAAPYFRVFNPLTQGEKFDPDGAYVRKWVPELAGIPTEFIHHPWTAPAYVLKSAGVTLGTTYPRPIVDHAEARDAALDAWRSIRAE